MPCSLGSRSAIATVAIVTAAVVLPTAAAGQWVPPEREIQPIIRGADACTLIFAGQFLVSDNTLTPRPRIPLGAASSCENCTSTYACTEGTDQNTPNRFNLHPVAATDMNRCIRVALIADCIGTQDGQNLGSAAYLAPFQADGHACDGAKLGTVGFPSPWPLRDGTYSFALPADSGADIIVWEQNGGDQAPRCPNPYTIMVESCECTVAVDLESFSIEP